MEQQTIVDILTNGYDYENGQVLTASEISENTGIPMKKLRGVLSSLEQKGAIQEVEFPDCMVWMLTI